MANNPIGMNKLRHILRLHTQGRSKLLISQQTGVARNTLKKYLKEFIASGLSFAEIGELEDKDLEDLFIKQEEKPVNQKLLTLFNLFPAMDKELKRNSSQWYRKKSIQPLLCFMESPGKSNYAHGA